MSVMMRAFGMLLLVMVLLGNSVGCGTLLYPERRGQTGGQLDPAVVIMDGLGLLLFIIPGIAAYVIDFATGAIYLPAGEARNNNRENWKKISEFDPHDTSFEDVVARIESHAGCAIGRIIQLADSASLKQYESYNMRRAAKCGIIIPFDNHNNL